MKVKDLIEELQYLDPQAVVRVSYPPGDYWGSVVAVDIEVVEEATLAWSEYHEKWQLEVDVYGDPKDIDEGTETTTCILIGA